MMMIDLLKSIGRWTESEIIQVDTLAKKVKYPLDSRQTA